MVTFNAKPCEVTHRLMCTPMAAILRSPTHTPVSLGMRPAAMPYSARVSMIACSIAAHVSAHVALPLAQIQNRVPHQLAGPVIRHVAAAVRGIKRDARALQHLVARQQVLHVPVAAHRDHVRMLQQQKLVRYGALLALLHQALLQFERLAVVHAAELAQPALTH